MKYKTISIISHIAFKGKAIFIKYRRIWFIRILSIRGFTAFWLGWKIRRYQMSTLALSATKKNAKQLKIRTKARFIWEIVSKTICVMTEFSKASMNYFPNFIKSCLKSEFVSESWSVCCLKMFLSSLVSLFGCPCIAKAICSPIEMRPSFISDPIEIFGSLFGVFKIEWSYKQKLGISPTS